MAHIIKQALKSLDRQAVINRQGGAFSYGELLSQSSILAQRLRSININRRREPIAVLCPPSEEYVVAQWGVWQAGGICVPLCSDHPLPELEYVLSNSGCTTVVSSSDLNEKAEQLSKIDDVQVLDYNDLVATTATATTTATVIDVEGVVAAMCETKTEDVALITYTSGTTGRPKGVPTTHKALFHQVEDMCEGWKWEENDRILHCLPLHHAHGIVAKLCCPLATGACVEFIEPKPERIIQRLSSEFLGPTITVLMGVPTLYAKLIEAYDRLPPEAQRDFSLGAAKLRLMVSGSAALPESVMQRWFDITNQVLLERYGMTEFAMAITNPYEPVSSRKPGYVGVPFPSVNVRIVDESDKLVPVGTQGNLQISGPTVFQGYWKNPAATEKEFSNEWFRTGDVALFDPQADAYKILGRASVDIIKSSGYKVSALEVERELLELGVQEAVVFGTPDTVYGEVITAVIRGQGEWNAASIKHGLKDKLPKYKIPQAIHFVDDIMKNPMGKVNKKLLQQEFKKA